MKKILLNISIITITGLTIPRIGIVSKSFNYFNSYLDSYISKLIPREPSHEMDLNVKKRRYYAEKNEDIYVVDDEINDVININNMDTAILVIDPWDNFPGRKINSYYSYKINRIVI